MNNVNVILIRLITYMVIKWWYVFIILFVLDFWFFYFINSSMYSNVRYVRCLIAFVANCAKYVDVLHYSRTGLNPERP